MSMEYIRQYYEVPAMRGARVEVDGRLGTITSSKGHQLRVRFDNEKFSRPCHPTWEIEYLGLPVEDSSWRSTAT